VKAHHILLMRQDQEITLRFRSAQQDKACGVILGEKRIGVALVDASLQELARAREASALMADRGQTDAGARGSIPDMLVRVTLKRTKPRLTHAGRGFKNNPPNLPRSHECNGVPEQ
jgi:hypothetical protein